MDVQFREPHPENLRDAIERAKADLPDNFEVNTKTGEITVKSEAGAQTYRLNYRNIEEAERAAQSGELRYMPTPRP